jgi:hypothetical protein
MSEDLLELNKTEREVSGKFRLQLLNTHFFLGPLYPRAEVSPSSCLSKVLV